MENELYSGNDVCRMLGISAFTLDNWYMWEAKEIRNGEVTERYLPIPLKDKRLKGCPRRWTFEMVVQLMEFQGNIVRGRNGKYGKYTNPSAHLERSSL